MIETYGRCGHVSPADADSCPLCAKKMSESSTPTEAGAVDYTQRLRPFLLEALCFYEWGLLLSGVVNTLLPSALGRIPYVTPDGVHLRNILLFVFSFDLVRGLLCVGMWFGKSFARKAAVFWTGMSIWFQLSLNVQKPFAAWRAKGDDANTLWLILGLASMVVMVCKWLILRNAATVHFFDVERANRAVVKSPLRKTAVKFAVAAFLVSSIIGTLTTYAHPYFRERAEQSQTTSADQQ